VTFVCTLFAVHRREAGDPAKLPANGSAVKVDTSGTNPEFEKSAVRSSSSMTCDSKDPSGDV